MAWNQVEGAGSVIIVGAGPFVWRSVDQGQTWSEGDKLGYAGDAESVAISPDNEVLLIAEHDYETKWPELGPWNPWNYRFSGGAVSL